MSALSVLSTGVDNTMSNRTFESIPEFLQGKTIAITGTFPGVGKSYVKNNWVNNEKLRGF